MRSILAGLLVMGAALAAVGVRAQPLSSLPTRKLRVAVILTEKTKTSVREGMERSSRATMPGGVTFRANDVFDAVLGFMEEAFRTIKVMEDPQEAIAFRAHLICVMDMGLDFVCEGLSCEADSAVELTFKTPPPASEPKGTLRAAVKGKSAWAVHTMVREVGEKLRVRLEQELPGAEELLAFAETAKVRKRRRSGRRRAGTEGEVNVKPVPGQVSDVDTPAYRSAEDPNNYALVIGVEKYSHVPEAQFAERDATAVREHLLALGFPERNVIFLKGDRGGRAALETYVESWLPQNVNKDSKVLFFFSGHGAPDVESKQSYIVPWDGDPKFLKKTGYPLKRLYSKLNALKAKEIIVAMDSCFSGAGGRSVLAEGTRPLAMRIEKSTVPWGKIVVLAAADQNEVTGAEESQGHGLFTYYFLKGLNEKKGEATVKDLYDYLLPKVQDAARRQNREQTPKLLGSKTDLRLKD
ncbi:MAG: caspase family protein [Elusimicrobiota bacterium]